MSSSNPGRRLFLVPLILLAGYAQAATWTCGVSATGPNFGIYNPFTVTPTVANGLITVTCTLTSGGAATVNVVDSFSTGASGSYATRTMISGANKLNYNIYYDAAYTSIRGNGTGGAPTGGATYNLTSTNPSQTNTGIIYGRIPAGQNVAAGSYTDVITLTLTF